MNKNKKTDIAVVEKTAKANSKKNYKLSDEEFFEALRENAGILAKTARAIEKEYGIKYSRQAVEDRAKRSPEKLREIKEAALDDAEEIMTYLMKHGGEKVRADMVKFVLKTQGKQRGYTEKIEQHNTGEVTIKSVVVEHISTGIPLCNSEKDVDLTKYNYEYE